MEYKKMKDRIYLRIDKEEEIFETIKAVCTRERVFGGYFQGIGACNRVTLSSYLPEKNEFMDHTISAGMIDMVSLMGNISMDCNGMPYLHGHAVFSYLNEKGELAMSAGHLKEAEINYTGEIIIMPAGDTIGRKTDPKTGIEVWKII